MAPLFCQRGLAGEHLSLLRILEQHGEHALDDHRAIAARLLRPERAIDLGHAAHGDAVGDAYSLIEGLIGSSYGDELTGNGKANTLRGLGGNDTLAGLGGKDLLIGNRGADTLLGGGGKDTLRGEKGNDTLTGGGGTDKFVFGLGDGRDVITDFRLKGKAEKIDIREFDVDSFADLKDLMSTKKGDTIINFGEGDRLTIEDVTAGQFLANDFIL